MSRRPEPVIAATEPDLGPPPVFSPSHPPLIPPAQEDRQRVATEAEIEAQEAATPTELTDEERRWFGTLLTVGRRTKTISVFEHEVVIHNLTTDDDLRVGLYVRDFQNAPPATQRAYQLATCAAGVQSIDGTELVSLLGPTDDDAFYAKKIAAMKRYYPVVITEIYNQIIALDAEFYELAVKLGKAPGSTNQPKS